MIRLNNELAEIIDFNNKSLNLLKSNFKDHFNYSKSIQTFDNESYKKFHSNDIIDKFYSINALWEKNQNESTNKTFIYRHIEELDMILFIDYLILRNNINLINQYIENSNYFSDELFVQMDLKKLIKDNELISL